MSFFPPLFIKDIIPRYKICSWQSFSFSTWKILCYFFLASMVSDNKYTVIVLSLASFNIFLSFVFKSLIMMCLCVKLLAFITFGILSEFKFMYFTLLGVFSAIFCLNILSFPPFSPFGIPTICIFSYCPTGQWDCSFFCSVYFLSFVQILNYLQIHWFYPLSSCLYLSSTSEIFILITVFLFLKFLLFSII